MEEEGSKIEFAVGNEVSPVHFFKSTFARSLVTDCRDAKSLECVANDSNNNYNEEFSLIELERYRGDPWKRKEVPAPPEMNEVEKLRKQCETLTEENRRLQDALTNSQSPHLRIVDNMYLQTQLGTVQWQLKQAEANRQMYRSLLEQVLRFLERARRSLDILHEKNTSTEKSGIRVPRSRSVHAVHSDTSGTSSRFTRAKSVAQMTGNTGIREFTWSVLRRNESAASKVSQEKSEDLNKTHDGVYRRPKQMELDPDDVPPEKLSQEAFRLMRTVQSLLSMREPDLARLTPINRSSPSPDHHAAELYSHQDSFSLQNGFSDLPAESKTIPEHQETQPETLHDNPETLQDFLPGARRSVDENSLHSTSSKVEEDLSSCLNDSAGDFQPTSSTPKIPEKRFRRKPKGPASVSSDESGFSSMSSFQEIGIPFRGFQEIGLPEVNLEDSRHRRWSSIPVQSFVKRNNDLAESVSVWV